MGSQGNRLSELAEVHGTPLLVIDGPTVEREVTRFREALAASPGGRLLYASKALSLVPLIERIAAFGADIEAVSPGEVTTALEAGVEPSRLVVNGSPKSPEEIDFYVRSGVSTFVLDAFEEVDSLEGALASHHREASVLIRYTPERAPDTHRYVQTAGRDSKFGFLKDEVLQVADRVLRSERIHWTGIHVHIGSNLMTIDDHLGAGTDASDLIAELLDRTGVLPRVLDLGGGFAASRPDRSPDITGLVRRLDTVLSRRFGASRPQIWFEPGRALIEGAGTLVYRVLSVKRRPTRPIVLLDGGMGDNIRPALYGAEYEIGFHPMHEGPTGSYEVYGRYCESGDRIGTVQSGPVQPGDLAFLARAGAYTYSMASNYNRVGRPAVVWDDPSGSAILARREDPSDILRLDGLRAEPLGIRWT